MIDWFGYVYDRTERAFDGLLDYNPPPHFRRLGFVGCLLIATLVYVPVMYVTGGIFNAMNNYARWQDRRNWRRSYR